MFEYLTDEDHTSIEATLIYFIIALPIIFGGLAAIILAGNNIYRVGLILVILWWFKSEWCYDLGTLPGALVHYYRSRSE